ncbi:transposable element Tc1 transposase [Trichonephila clavipes]|nr:transposable element Tc1 transposase [Trichonephila clavipes]
MDEDVIVKLKRIYRKQVLCRILLAENDKESSAAFSEKLNMKDGCNIDGYAVVPTAIKVLSHSATAAQETLQRRNEGVQCTVKITCPVACNPLIPLHCRSRRQWCQAKAYWTTEWRFVVFSDEIGFFLGARDSRVLVRRRPGERLQPNFYRPRYTEPTPGVIIYGAISYDSSFLLSQTH